MRRPELRALSRFLGVVDAYVPVGSRRSLPTSDATRVALLAAMGVDGSTERSAAATRRRLADEAARRTIDPCRVASPESAPRLVVRVDTAAPVALDWEIDLALEGGRRIRRRGRGRFSSASPTKLDLGRAVPPGYHRLVLRLDGPGTCVEVGQDLVATPSSCAPLGSVLRSRRVFGIGANLYSVRDRDTLGVGDLAVLRRLIRWTADHGGAFVGVNPLGAQRIREGDVSPYSPSSRIFRSLVYVDLGAVPELADVPTGRAAAALRDASDVPYRAALDLKEKWLRTAHRRLPRSAPSRRRAFERFVRERGVALQDFATFEALQAHRRRRGLDPNWRTWPPELRDPRSAAVERFRDEHRDEVSFHRFVQFELARQLDAVQVEARRRGMDVGVYQDLPVGVSADGGDAWAWSRAFAEGARIGAPPDDFQADGQDWGLPPLVPYRLGEIGYRYWVEIVRAAFRGAGAVRIDHAMGLARQYWVTGHGRERRGAYVAQPFDALMGIVALESRRAGALVIGEDLGTVPGGFRPRMARWGALSMRILYFERGSSGAHRPSRAYPPQALVAANTHDLPTLPAFWSGSDLDLEARLARRSASEVGVRRRGRERERDALRRRLEGEGHLSPRSCPTADDVMVAVHRHLADTPSALLSVSLDDLAGETEPVNLPGVPGSVYPSWTRRMRRPLDEVTRDPLAKRILEAVADRRPAPPRTRAGRPARPRTGRKRRGSPRSTRGR